MHVSQWHPPRWQPGRRPQSVILRLAQLCPGVRWVWNEPLRGALPPAQVFLGRLGMRGLLQDAEKPQSFARLGSVSTAP